MSKVELDLEHYHRLQEAEKNFDEVLMASSMRSIVYEKSGNSIHHAIYCDDAAKKYIDELYEKKVKSLEEEIYSRTENSHKQNSQIFHLGMDLHHLKQDHSVELAKLRDEREQETFWQFIKRKYFNK